MSNPKVSIVMTNYNGEKFIREAIQSVLSQTCTDWELIIVDDCSTDSSLSVAEEFHDPRIRIIRCEANGQVSMAHNVGNKAAAGEYIATLDNDDLWAPEKLEKQIQYLEEHPNTDLCFTLANFIDESGNPIEDKELEAIISIANRSREEWLHLFLTTGNHLLNDSSVIRRKVLETVGDNDICLLQLHDYDYWVRSALHFNFYIIEEPLMSYRRHSASLSAASYGKIHRTCFEFAWIIGRTITEMPADLFRKVFRAEMKCPKEKSEAAVLCEKAILLSSDLLHENCRAFAFPLFKKILADSKTAEVLKNVYGMTQHDVYKVTEIVIFFDRYSSHEYMMQYKQYEELQKQYGELEKKYEQLSREFEKHQTIMKKLLNRIIGR